MNKPTIPSICEQCGSNFLTYSSSIKNGYGKFCSRLCARLNQWANHAATVQKECEQCGTSFNAKAKLVKRGGARFCSQPCAKASKVVPAEMRFWAKVNKTETCWRWTAGTNRQGYGVFNAPGFRAAHVFSYALHHGPIPKSLCVLHHCDTPQCVRPSHLFLGTRAVNNLDMAMKERATSPLTTAQVRQIRIRYARGGVTQKQLGIEFGVHTGTIKGIIQRRRWAHVD